MSKAKRGGKVSAHSSHQSFSRGGGGGASVEISPTITNMLEELKQLVKKTQEERTKGESTILTINKTHDKMKQEVRISPYFKQKLVGLYTNALADAKNEVGMLDQALNKLAEIKQEVGEKKARSTAIPRNIEDVTKRTGTMRRGMLMTVLQQYALEQPVWRGKPGENPPPLCGCTPAEDKYKCQPEDQVAARVNTDTNEDEQWILAVVVSYNSHYHRYIVDDIDEEGHIEKKQYQVSKRRVIPLPTWKADPSTTPQALFKPGQKVLALYPQTTCFYPAVIHEQPKTVEAEYSVLFEDNTYFEGYSPPLDVPQRYVLPMRETRRRQAQ
ncbi:PREDICTED: SAGA-associated factor 29-like [Amphimedon queenslandica]|uniref:SGF29 C-terminal domain-containing protein n=1 Tax=Amphimedon queenslandica TaxID=400682 RepID=A0A1X7V1I7_AMPQE|nr:PREDICTED: SAGA-associated factor 29-like [Amphimedon queenslandica]|eukprot:XP_003386069.1 PREDICTED: SAGA-associated factor 29-like [Amphimedon queenslandica]